MSETAIDTSQGRQALVTSVTLLDALKKHVRRGDWERFYAMYRGVIRGYAIRKGVRPEDADDIVQEVMITMLRVLPDFVYDRKRGRFLSYLMTVAYFRIMRHLKKIRPSESLEDSASAIWEASMKLHGVKYEKERRLWKLEWQKAVLTKGLELVRNKVRRPSTLEAFRLFVIEGWPAKRVAEATGLSVNGVHLAKRNVLEKLRKIWPEIMKIGLKI